MNWSAFKSIRYLIIPLILIVYSCASSSAFVQRDVRYIKSTIRIVNKKSIELQDGTIWGFNYFSINTPGNDVLVVFDRANSESLAFIDGIAKYVDFLGTTYQKGRDIDDIIHYNKGKLTTISQIDSSGKFLSLGDSTVWMVRPDQVPELKKWQVGERIILGKGKKFIINPRRYTMVKVHKIATQHNNEI